MTKKILGLDIIRAYELSCLNAKGKPIIAILEYRQEDAQPPLDTWLFKKFLESINNKTFADLVSLKLAIATEFNLVVNNLFFQNNSIDLEFFEKTNFSGFRKETSQMLRVICDQTGQPYIGTVTILHSDNQKINPDLLTNILTEIRNSEFAPQTLVSYLFNKIQEKIEADFILSVHLNRRGGIGFQALRTTLALDLSVFSCRSILE